MAGVVGNLATEDPLLRDQYAHQRAPARKKKRTRPAKGGKAVPKHPGFKAVQAGIARKEGVSSKAAGAILASSSRNASPAAKKKNPALTKVKGKAGKKKGKPFAKKKAPAAPPRPSPIASAMGVDVPDATY